MIDWEDIKARHTIEDELQRRGVQLRRNGGSYICKCPLHGEQKGASFSIDIKKQLWRCFGKCAAGGDVIKLVEMWDGVDAATAAEILEGRQLRDDSAPPRLRTPPPPRIEVPAMRELPLPQKFWKGEQRHWEAVAKQRKLPHTGGVELAVRHGCLRFCVAYDHPAWVILDAGNPCNVQARRMDGELWFGDKKVMGFKGNWAKWPVGLDAVLRIPSAEVLLVEGTGDFVAAWHCVVDGYTGGIPLAMFGASNTIHESALALLEGRNVRILEQHDRAGAQAAKTWAGQLQAAGCWVQSVLIPTPGEDLNDHLSNGRDAAPLFEATHETMP